jgi:hypothetical protein
MCTIRLGNQYMRPRPGKGCRATGKEKRINAVWIVEWIY